MLRLLIVLSVCTSIPALPSTATAVSADSQPAIEWENSEFGETAFIPMKSAPYPHPSRDQGFTYNNVTFPRDPHYSDSTVGLFIPKDIRRTPKTNVLLYLHGWSNNVRKAMDEFKLREQIAASGQNIILIFPEGPRDATDSGCGKLEDQDGLKHLVEESLAALHAAGKIDTKQIGHVLISSHSGAYKGLSCAADHGGLDHTEKLSHDETVQWLERWLRTRKLD